MCYLSLYNINVIEVTRYQYLFLCDFFIIISHNKTLQPIPEQLGAMTCFEDSDVINLINLYVVVTQIFDKIFLHDFCLTDITSPGTNILI